MARSTQFIGLNQKASDFVKNLEKLPSDTAFFGMFDERFELGRWSLPKTEQWEESNKREDPCVREVFQASPWSSGPMIFTCLEVDFGNGGKTKIFQWVKDPTLGEQHIEFDMLSGSFWV